MVKILFNSTDDCLKQCHVCFKKGKSSLKFKLHEVLGQGQSYDRKLPQDAHQLVQELDGVVAARDIVAGSHQRRSSCNVLEVNKELLKGNEAIVHKNERFADLYMSLL